MRLTGAAAQATPGAAQQAESKPNDYMEKVVKLIPSEVVALFLLYLSVLRDKSGDQLSDQPEDLIGLFVVGLVLTPLYLYFMADKADSKWVHMGISTVAFVLWSLSIAGQPLLDALQIPLSLFMISVLLAAFTLLSGLLPMEKPPAPAKEP